MLVNVEIGVICFATLLLNASPQHLEDEKDSLRPDDSRKAIEAQCDEEMHVNLTVPFGGILLLLGLVFFVSSTLPENTTNDKKPDDRCDQRKVVTLKEPSFILKYGVFDEIGRYKMLLTCGRKAKQMGDTRYGRTLLQEYRDYTGDQHKIDSGILVSMEVDGKWIKLFLMTEKAFPTWFRYQGHKTFRELSRMVASNISAEQWMRFVRLHLNLNNEEIDEVRLKYCVITDEQVNQIWYWSARQAELGSVLDKEFK